VVSLSHATVTGILDRLERRGVVQRHRSDSDRRQIVVRLTEQGHKALASAPPPLQESFLNNFRRLQDWEQTLVLSSLQRIASMMQVGEIDGGPVLVSGPITATVEQTASFLAHPEVCQEAHVEPGSPEGPDPTKK
jgi:predicted ArsR family transcriptional regulator